MPAPGFPSAMRPSKDANSSGWSGVCTARRSCSVDSGTPFRQRPEHEDAAMLQPEILVQTGGIMLLDDERE